MFEPVRRVVEIKLAGDSLVKDGFDNEILVKDLLHRSLRQYDTDIPLKICSVKPHNDMEIVYNFKITNSENHWGVIDGIIVHDSTNR